MNEIKNYYDLLQALIKENLENKKIKQHRQFLFHPIEQERGRRLEKFWATAGQITSVQARFAGAEKIYGQYEAQINKILSRNPYKTEVHDFVERCAYPLVTSNDIADLLQSRTGKKWTVERAFSENMHYPTITFKSESGERLSITPVYDKDVVQKDEFGAARMENKDMSDGYINWFTALQCPTVYGGGRAYENPNSIPTIWVIPEKIEKVVIDHLRTTPIKYVEHSNEQPRILSDEHLKEQPALAQEVKVAKGTKTSDIKTK